MASLCFARAYNVTCHGNLGSMTALLRYPGDQFAITLTTMRTWSAMQHSTGDAREMACMMMITISDALS